MEAADRPLSYSLAPPASKMQPRRPSTTSSMTLLNNSLRRRSSAVRSGVQDNLKSKVDDNDTIVLRPGLASVSSPPLPALPVFSSTSRLEDNAKVTRVTLRDPAPEPTLDKPIFSPTPLLACPEVPSRAPSTVSEISRLPTPPFSSQPPSPTADKKFLPSLPSFSFLPSGLNFLSFGGEPTNSLSPIASNGPQSVRNDSGSSSSSTESDIRNEKETLRSDTSASFRSHGKGSLYSCRSIDSGHRSLIPSIGTTDKFTHKWPTPQSLRHGKSGPERKAKGGAALGQMMEDGQGLGLEKVDKWTSFKWCLLFSVISVFVYGGGGLVAAILTWFRAWDRADVMYVADNDILILITLASSILLFTSLLGFTGTLLNSRPILALYALLLWPALASILAVGYVAYKRSAYSLDRKLNLAWSQWYTELGRLMIQDSLRCCGFYTALHDAAPSGRCYPRTALPGCKGRLYRFEKANLGMIWSGAFGVSVLHLVNIIVALLCANHITERFGMGITPKKYRLDGSDVRSDAERIMKVVRPEISRANSSGVFREDRVERREFLERASRRVL